MYINRVEVAKGDTIIATFRSDEVTEQILKEMKAQLQAAFPDNKIATIGVASRDKMDLLVIGELQKSASSSAIADQDLNLFDETVYTPENQERIDHQIDQMLGKTKYSFHQKTELQKQGRKFNAEGELIPLPKQLSEMNEAERKALFEENSGKHKRARTPGGALTMPNSQEELVGLLIKEEKINESMPAFLQDAVRRAKLDAVQNLVANLPSDPNYVDVMTQIRDLLK